MLLDAIDLLIAIVTASIILRLVPLQNYALDNKMLASEYEKTTFETTSDYSDHVVYDDSNGHMYPTYNYLHLLNSFAIQGAKMPCDNLVFNTKYITKDTAKRISQKVIVKQLDISASAPDLKNVRFVLMYEGGYTQRKSDGSLEKIPAQAVWYQVLIDDTTKQNLKTDGKEVIVLRKNPAYEGYKDTIHSRYTFDMSSNDIFVR